MNTGEWEELCLAPLDRKIDITDGVNRFIDCEWSSCDKGFVFDDYDGTQSVVGGDGDNDGKYFMIIPKLPSSS